MSFFECHDCIKLQPSGLCAPQKFSCRVILPKEQRESPMTDIDYLVYPQWIVPIIPRQTVLTDHCIAVADGQIVDLCPSSQGRTLNAKHSIELPGQVLMPGLVNCHGHSAMTLFRGYADDQPLMTWLQQHIWPAEKAFVSEDFVRDGTDLALAELLLGGTTTFSDMYFYPDITAQRADFAGLRAQLVFPVLDGPSAWARDSEDYLAKGLQLRDHYRDHERIEIGFGPHANYTVSEATLKRVATLANELDAPVQIHLHETQGEVQMSVENLGERPIEQLQRIGLLGPRSQCVHMTALADADFQILESTGAHVIHCPRSNMKLAAGICPVQRLLDRHINVALGTDGAASNNRLNMIAEMQGAALLGKLESGESAAVSAVTALEMATINGAKALGMEQKIGSLEIGKQADMIALQMDGLAMQPINNVLSHLVYATSGAELTHSWVAGHLLVVDQQLSTLSASHIAASADSWRARLLDFHALKMGTHPEQPPEINH